MSTAVLSLGSNLGDRLGYLRLAVSGIAEVSELIGVSPVYETAPWGGVEQGDFLNAVLIARSPSLDAWGWLRLGQRLEQAAARVREVHWGPRTLDVDVVAVFSGDDPHDETAAVRSDDPELRLPHPGTAERNTVLRPWLDIDPDAVLPGHAKVADLLARLGEAGLRRCDGSPLEPTR